MESSKSVVIVYPEIRSSSCLRVSMLLSLYLLPSYLYTKIDFNYSILSVLRKEEHFKVKRKTSRIHWPVNLKLCGHRNFLTRNLKTNLVCSLSKALVPWRIHLRHGVLNQVLHSRDALSVIANHRMSHYGPKFTNSPCGNDIFSGLYFRFSDIISFYDWQNEIKFYSVYFGCTQLAYVWFCWFHLVALFYSPLFFISPLLVL